MLETIPFPLSVLDYGQIMVDTRRLEKLMSLTDSSAKADRSVDDINQPRRSLALSGHRDMRRAGQGKARNVQRQAMVDANWADLDRCVSEPTADKRSRQFNVMARNADVISRFDILRTQLVQSFRSRGLTSLGISAPADGVGTSFAAAGLIASLARRGDLRVIGLDLNLRAPALHRYFEVAPAGSMLDFLNGETPPEVHLQRLTDTVALGLGQPVSDMVLSTGFSADDLFATLSETVDRYAPDMIVCDLPPLLRGDTALSICSHLDGVLLVADSQRTRAEDITACERLLTGQTEFLGVILNNYSGGGQN